MYISRMPLNVARYEGLRLVSSPYRLHGAVEKSFPPGTTRSDKSGRILWRLDTTNHGEEVWLYVVSPVKPDFTHIIEQAGWLNGGEQQTKDYEPLLGRIALGQHWNFRLRANTVRYVFADRCKRDVGKDPKIATNRMKGHRGRLKGDVTAKYQMDWLLKRCRRNGFRVLASPNDPSQLECVVSQRRTERFLRHNNSHPVTLTTCQFDGILEITDPSSFEHMLRFGIGRGRGFGCGLMTIAPV